MLRYFTKKLIAIHFLAISAIVVCLALSSWQWTKAHYASAPKPNDGSISFSELSPLRDFLPAGSIGIDTKVSGTWQPNSRLSFAQRPADGAQLINPNPGSESVVSWAVPIGSWIVDVLVLDDGSSLGVVRGWSDNPDQVPAPTGSVELTGVMQPSEDAAKRNLLNLPSYISTNTILAKADSTLHDGFFVASTSTGLETVKPTFGAPIKVELHWRNVVYTLNWIIFAVIILAMWWRIIRDEVKQ